MKTLPFSKFIGVCCLLILATFVGSSFSTLNSLSENSDNTPTDDQEKSLAAFDIILQVLKSPRCMNCHPSDNFPRQGDDRHIHLFNVERGPENKGLVVQKCATCHHEENNAYANIPGAPHWALAPPSMGWMGLSDAALGAVLTDLTKNGGRSPEQLVEHMSNDRLVLWAWEPGEGRTVPPVPLEEFRKALNIWLVNGSYVPEKQ